MTSFTRTFSLLCSSFKETITFIFDAHIFPAGKRIRRRFSVYEQLTVSCTLASLPSWFIMHKKFVMTICPLTHDWLSCILCISKKTFGMLISSPFQVVLDVKGYQHKILKQIENDLSSSHYRCRITAKYIVSNITHNWLLPKIIATYGNFKSLTL